MKNLSKLFGIFTVILLALGIGAAVPNHAAAHHSTAANFTQEIIEKSGTIERVRFVNPHASILLRVPAESGAVFWLVETDARSTMERKGVTTEMLKIGSKVTASGRRGKRANTMYLRELVMESGAIFTSDGLEEGGPVPGPMPSPVPEQTRDKVAAEGSSFPAIFIGAALLALLALIFVLSKRRK